jgi:DnaJ-class molecular chaperone
MTRDNTLPFAKLSQVDEEEPAPELKCRSCAGDGVITIFSVTTGEPLCTQICPTCGGSRYEP